MLGWEFPPLVSGGLGLASLGLSQALANHCQLRLIVPKALPDALPSSVQAVSLHALSPEAVAGFAADNFEFVQQSLKQLAALSPYDSEALQALASPSTTTASTATSPSGPEPVSPSSGEPLPYPAPLPFTIEEPYGRDLLPKLMAYSQLAAHLALQEEFDLIHAHDWLTFVAAIEIKRQTGKPLVLHMHSLEYDRSGPDQRGWVFQLEKYAMEQADLVIPVSTYTAQLIQLRYGIEPERIEPVHNGLDAVQPYRLPKRFPEPLITFMGRLTEQKNPGAFIRLAMHLLGRRRNLRFAIAGDGPLKLRLMEEVARFQLGDRVHFTGFLDRDEVYDLLAMSDVFVLPSRSEPFGLAALEAASFGVPTIISQYSGVAEVLPHAPRIEPGELMQVAGYVQRMLEDPTYRNRIGQVVQQDAMAMSWDRAAKQVVGLYQQLLA